MRLSDLGPDPVGLRGGHRIRAFVGLRRCFVDSLRGSLRALLLFLWTAAAYLPMRLSLRLTGRMLEPGRRFRSATFRAWCRFFLRLSGARVQVLGSAPQGQFFLVGNHLGYVDILLLGAHLPDCCFVAQSGVADWPLIGPLAASLDTVFVDRGDLAGLRQVNAQVAATLDQGRSIVLFPEGTSSPGIRVERFMPPVLEPAAARRMPVHPCSVAYKTEADRAPAHDSICWWGDMGFADHAFRLLCLPGYEARLVFGDAPVVSADRKNLARELERSVGKIFRPTVEGEAAWRIAWP
jgi:1-acyl-sn-glycerol-3-phosphate acyltransferase